jgi:2-iminobutanoate/2-iminopropanoate deaminase
MKEAVFTERAPRPIGPYSQAIIAGDLIFVSGQIPIDPSTGRIVSDDFKEQVRRALDNVKAILEAGGSSLDDVVKVTVYLKDPSRFQDFNQIYSEYFKGSFPARTTVFVNDLPAGAQIEVDVIAVRHT